MKKQFLSIAVTAMILLLSAMLTACAVIKTGDGTNTPSISPAFSPDTASPEVTAGDAVTSSIAESDVTSKVAETAIPDTVAVPDTTTAPVTETDAPTETTASPEETTAEIVDLTPRVNESVLSDIGKTYAELVEKYGERLGGYTAVFVNKKGVTDRYSYHPNDKFNDTFSLESTAICCQLQMPIEELFIGLSRTDPISFEELERIYQVKCEFLDKDNGEIKRNFYSSGFKYDKFSKLAINILSLEYGMTGDSCIIKFPESPRTLKFIDCGIFSDLELDFTALVEKYGVPITGVPTYQNITFNGGIGTYSWYDNMLITGPGPFNVKEQGKCNVISNIKISDLFVNVRYADYENKEISIEDFAESYGCEIVYKDILTNIPYIPRVTDSSLLYKTQLRYKDYAIYIFTVRPGTIYWSTRYCTITKNAEFPDSPVNVLETLTYLAKQYYDLNVVRDIVSKWSKVVSLEVYLTSEDTTDWRGGSILDGMRFAVTIKDGEGKTYTSYYDHRR